MESTTIQPTLLSAARNFICKLAGTAVLAVIPLAAVSLAPEAKGRGANFGVASFGNVALSGGSTVNFNSSGGASTTPASVDSGIFFFNLAPANSVEGIKFGATITYGVSQSDAPGDFRGTSYFYSTGGSGSLLDGSSLPFSWDFTLTPTGGVSAVNWELEIINPTFHQFFGSGTGNITGSDFFSVIGGDLDLSSTGIEVRFMVTFTAASASDSITLSMNQGSGQGIALNAVAIPEPSTYAAAFGLGALGFVLVRRSRRSRDA